LKAQHHAELPLIHFLPFLAEFQEVNKGTKAEKVV
jgi:hypothetical protein